MKISLRRLGRRASALGAVGAMVALAAAAPAGATTTAPSPATSTTSTYLALGDSVAFGYVPAQAVPPPVYTDAASFVGYPEDLARAYNLHVVNASCPGETTISMIAAGGLSNGCENSPISPVGYRTVYPLHASYSGTQLSFAETFLKAHPTTSLVTIDIGANDAFVCQETTKDHCTNPAELGAVLAQIKQNLATIYKGLRDVAGYTGTIVAVSYYSTNYANVKLTVESKVLDTIISQVTSHYGGYVADGFGAFQAASAPYAGSTCKAGLLIPIPGHPCNVHPTPAGHLLLASAISKVLAHHHLVP